MFSGVYHPYHGLHIGDQALGIVFRFMVDLLRFTEIAAADGIYGRSTVFVKIFMLCPQAV